MGTPQANILYINIHWPLVYFSHDSHTIEILNFSGVGFDK